MSRTVNPLFLAQHDIGFEIKDQVGRTRSGALAFNRKFPPEGLRGAALAAEIFLPPFFLLSSSFLPPPLPPSPGAGMHTQADLLIYSKGYEHATCRMFLYVRYVPYPKIRFGYLKICLI